MKGRETNEWKKGKKGENRGRKEKGRERGEGGWISMVPFVGLHGYLHCHNKR